MGRRMDAQRSRRTPGVPDDVRSCQKQFLDMGLILVRRSPVEDRSIFSLKLSAGRDGHAIGGGITRKQALCGTGG